MYKELLQFLSELKENNFKEWFDENRPRYEALRKDFILLVEEMINHISTFDKKIPLMDPKSCIFRINRDIRFSKDKSPYKTHFSAFICSEGRKSAGPGYYFHVEPGNKSMLAGGVYMPAADLLKKIREEIDYNGDALANILNEPSYKKMFGQMEEAKLTRAPKGYPEDHPHIELLKFKSFISYQMVDDKQIEKGEFEKLAKKTFQTVYPLMEFLYQAKEA